MKRKITLDIEKHPRESHFLYSFGSRKTTRVPQEFIFSTNITLASHKHG
jgi:hypothetical protein